MNKKGEMRIDKLLSHCGYGTRKQVKALLKQKIVRVNDIVITNDSKHVHPGDDIITVDNQVVHYQQYTYLMMNKPANVISATEDAQTTVIDLLDHYVKDIFPVGRLDKDTTGLLILTNDGQFAHQITAPNHQIEKVYEVTTLKKIDTNTIQLFKEGIVIDGDEKCLPAKLEIISDQHCFLTIVEGKYHQVKRMFIAVDNLVVELKRVQIGQLKLDPNLKLGQYRELTTNECMSLVEGFNDTSN